MAALGGRGAAAGWAGERSLTTRIGSRVVSISDGTVSTVPEVDSRGTARECLWAPARR